jgi:hypothetical protein
MNNNEKFKQKKKTKLNYFGNQKKNILKLEFILIQPTFFENYY